MKLPFTFKFQSDNVLIEITFRSLLAIIIGDSATGKSFIAKRIDTFISEKSLNEEIKSNWDINKIHVYSDKNGVQDVYDKEGCIIILDRFDMYVNKQLLDFINTGKNLFVIMYRGSNIKLKVKNDNMFILKHKINGDNIHFYTQWAYASD